MNAFIIAMNSLRVIIIKISYSYICYVKELPEGQINRVCFLMSRFIIFLSSITLTMLHRKER